MSVLLKLADAAYLAGIESYTPVSAGSIAASIGTRTSLTTSWATGALAAGQSGTASEHFSSGYVADTALTLLNDSTVQVTASSLSLNGNTLWSWTGSVLATRTGFLTDLTDAQILSGNDTLVGNSYGNALAGLQGNDTIDGGGGTDTAVYLSAKSLYSITQNSGSVSVSGPEGTDTLTSIERLQFSDYDVAFDLDGAPGQAYRLYRAAFDRTPDLPGLGFQIGALDSGLTLTQVAANFIASPEFAATYGAVDSTQFLTLLYRNVLHREPDVGGLQFHLQELADGQTRADPPHNSQ